MLYPRFERTTCMSTAPTYNVTTGVWDLYASYDTTIAECEYIPVDVRVKLPLYTVGTIDTNIALSRHIHVVPMHLENSATTELFVWAEPQLTDSVAIKRGDVIAQLVIHQTGLESIPEEL